ncbi:uncharacterized protein [Taeniopygia guttata]|uniref:uncharacterized protein n=1 Tax=Taeniopygia guttata TaxID=59729 RepID=UPI003BB89AE0
MQCERRAAREKRGDVNPWLSGSTSGPRQGCPLLLAPASRPRPAAAGLLGAVRAPGAAAPATATVCGAGFGAAADFFCAYVQPGASRAPSRPRSCKVTQPGTEAAAPGRAGGRGRGKQGSPAAPGRRGGRDTQSRPREASAGREGRGSAPGVPPTPLGSPAERWRRGQPRSAVGRPPAAGRHLPAAATDVRASPAPAGSRLPPPALFPSLLRNLHNAVGRAAGARLSGGAASAVFTSHGQRRAADRTCRDAPGEGLLHLPWHTRRANTLLLLPPLPPPCVSVRVQVADERFTAWKGVGETGFSFLGTRRRVLSLCEFR